MKVLSVTMTDKGAEMDRLYSKPFNITVRPDDGRPVPCVIMSARAAVFAVRMSIAGRWFYHIQKFEQLFDIGHGYVAIGYSPMTGKMIAVNMDALEKNVRVNLRTY